MYVDNSLITIDESMLAKFRRRFRLPYNNCIELVEMCREDKQFQKIVNLKCIDSYSRKRIDQESGKKIEKEESKRKEIRESPFPPN